MENYLKVKDYPEFVRDKKSNAILNIDSVSLNKYKEERNKLININKVIKEHEKMKKDRKSTRLNSSHVRTSRMPSSA